MDYIILGFLILCCILLTISIFKKHNYIEIDNKIKAENEKLLKDKSIYENEIKSLQNNKLEKQKDLEKLNEIIGNMNAAARTAFSEFQDTLDAEYDDVEEEYDRNIETLKQSYDNLQDSLKCKMEIVQKELDKIEATRAAALEAQLKEQEVKNKQSFYCPKIAEADLNDVKVLKTIENKLLNPRVLRMLIWSTYYQKPMNQVCANVLGAATASKCGIYKITNQITDLVYIGQAVDMATRWKNHAKAGLGIDTPQGNKLYKAMLDDGLENFSFEILEECDRDELNEKEKYYISLYKSDQYGYNLNAGINK